MRLDGRDGHRPVEADEQLEDRRHRDARDETACEPRVRSRRVGEDLDGLLLHVGETLRIEPFAARLRPPPVPPSVPRFGRGNGDGAEQDDRQLEGNVAAEHDPRGDADERRGGGAKGVFDERSIDTRALLGLHRANRSARARVEPHGMHEVYLLSKHLDTEERGDGGAES